MANDRPPELVAAIEQLRELLDPEELWVEGYYANPRDIMTSPLAGLVLALGSHRDPAVNERRWGRLALAAARRVRPCWIYRCDTDPLSPVIRATSRWVADGTEPTDWKSLIDAPVPTLHGKEFDHCGVTEANNAALAILFAAWFAQGRDPISVVECIRSADMAFYQSPLGGLEDFRKWVLDHAVPFAFADRDLSAAELKAERSYTLRQVVRWRESG